MISEDRTWEATSDVWSSVIEAIPDGVAVVDSEGVQRSVNRALCQMLGFDRTELVGARPPFPYWPEEHRETIQAAFERTIQGNFADFELTFQRKNGERFPVLVHPASVSSGDRIVGYVATVKDITERIRIEQALRRSEERWKSIAENPFDFVVIIDDDYRYLYVNHTAPGISATDLIGKATPFDYVDPDYHDVMRRALEQAFLKARPGVYDVYVPTLDKWYTNIVGPILEEGRVTAASILTRDTTAQKQAEQALRRSQRMETLGRLAGGIAHDFNNLLTPIVGNTQLALDELSRQDKAAEYLEDVIRAATRAGELVSRVLLFGRPASEQPRAVRVQDVAREVIAFVAVGASSNVTIQTDIDDRCPPVAGVPAEIHQIIANLCTNAVHALGAEGGTLRLSIGRAPIDTTLAQQHDIPEGPAVRIEIADDGPGIPQGTLDRVFDPFFTTRPVGEGTGLGLSIVHAIATRYGGAVTASSSPEAGTRFEVYLPLEDDAHDEQPAEPQRAATAPVAPAQRIVCVDDEELVLGVFCRVLEHAGHDVRGFSSSSEALAYLEEHAWEVDCVITDATMPGLSGVALARQLASLRPELPVVLASGYHGTPSPELPRNIRRFVQKPARPEVVLAAVRDATEPPDAARA